MKIKQSSKLLRAGAVALIIGLSLTLSQTPSYAEAGFQKWVNGFYSVARKNGINKSTYQRAFKGITSADPEILELTRHQPEFKQKMWMYFDSRVNENSLERGQEMKQTWDRWLTAIEKKYGDRKSVV